MDCALILWRLGPGPQRHGALARMLPGVSPKVLAERLEALCRLGLVERREAATFPRAVTYRRTADGDAMATILDQVEVWALRRREGEPASLPD